MSSATNLDDPRRHVRYKPEHIENVSSRDFPGFDPHEQYLWDLEQFREQVFVEIRRIGDSSLDIDLAGVDASIANAIRRILMSEVPTLAIDQVYMFNNTSVIQDEVLAQRVGLVPIRADPNEFDDIPDVAAGEGPTDRNTLVFRLLVECTRNNNAEPGEKDPAKLYHHSTVYSGDLKINYAGDQEERLGPADSELKAGVANPNIVLARLRPGQIISFEGHAYKATGALHAKWSPVATASYRLLPHIVIKEPIPPHLARKFQSCFSPGVIEVTDKNEVVVANPRKETMSREVFRHEEFKDIVELNRVRDYFMFNIESTGAIEHQKLFPEALRIMRHKIRRVRADAYKYLVRPMEGMDTEMAEA